MFDAVLFDLDGTLTDPARGIVSSFRHALDAVGHRFEDDDLTWMIGPPIRDNLVTAGVPAHLHDDAVHAFRERHTAIGLYDVTLHDGIVDLLASVRAAGSAIAVATFKPTAQAEATIDHLGLTDAVDAVVGVSHEMTAADKGPVVVEALRRLARPGLAVMIGDRHHDVGAGRGAGCRTIGVRWGYAREGELEACGPDHVVDTVDALSSILVG